MKLTGVELHPDGSSSYCEMSFKDPSRQNPYNVLGISGLDADDIVPRFYGIPGASSYYDLTLTRRDIVAKVELNPRYNLGEDVSSLRDALYRMIAASRSGMISVQFKNDATVVAQVSGFFRKLETDHFSATPAVLITIECQEPILKSPDPVAVNVAALDPAATDLEDLVSTAPHGFKFDITVTAVVAEFVMRNPASDWEFRLTPVASFQVNDIIRFSSEYNDKRIQLIRAGVTTHLADILQFGSVWPVMFPGMNQFVIEDAASYDWTSISYYLTYWGV